MNYYENAASQPGHYVVTQSSRNIKSLAKQALRGKWSAAIGMAFLIEIIMSGPGVILGFLGTGKFLAFLSDFYTIAITGPATVGLTCYYLGVFRMQNAGSAELLSPFRNKMLFFRALTVYCTMLLRILLWSILFVIPGIIAAYKYSMAFKVLADHPEMGSLDVLRESARIMDGNKIKLFLLQLSFWLPAIIVSIPKGICAWEAQTALGASAADLMVNMDIFNKFYDAYVGNPIIIISYLLGVILNVYVQVSECCFYDLASGNLIVRQAAYGE